MERAKSGFSFLAYSSLLGAEARNHSEDMRRRGYFSHNTPEGQTLFDRLASVGYYTTLAGELLASSQTTAQQVVTSLMFSANSRATILDPNYRELGVGVSSSNWLWTLIFATKFSSNNTQTPTRTPLPQPTTRIINAITTTVPFNFNFTTIPQSSNYTTTTRPNNYTTTTRPTNYTTTTRPQNYTTTTRPTNYTTTTRPNNYTTTTRPQNYTTTTRPQNYTTTTRPQNYTTTTRPQNYTTTTRPQNYTTTTRPTNYTTTTRPSNYTTTTRHNYTTTTRPTNYTTTTRPSNYTTTTRHNYTTTTRHNNTNTTTTTTVATWVVVFEEILFQLVNDERRKENLEPISLNSVLNDVAKDHSERRGEGEEVFGVARGGGGFVFVMIRQFLEKRIVVLCLVLEDMRAHGILSHTGSDGSSPFERINSAGYLFSAAGENVAQGQKTPEEVMADWIRSPGHRANILGKFKEIGIGLSSSGFYWTQVFATPLLKSNSADDPSTPDDNINNDNNNSNNDNNNNNNNNDGSLTGGEIAGIVVGSVVGSIVITVAIFFIIKRAGVNTDELLLS